jgi:hypothetical protein
MNKYIPPVQRKAAEPTFDESFPVLGSNINSKSVSKPTTASTFADKTREWEQQRIQMEIKMKTDARMAEYRLERASRQAEEDNYISGMLKPVASKRVHIQQIQAQDTTTKSDNDWVVVERKIKKKKETTSNEQYDNIELDHSNKEYHDDSLGNGWD